MSCRRHSSLVGCVLFCLLCVTLSNAQLDDRLNEYLRAFVDSGNFSGAVLVAQKGKIILRRGYGMANYELNVPNSPEIRFHIASVSKPFTAAAILQLEEQGRLQVADRVSRFLPNFPHGDEITLQHLLTHTSGIKNINDLPDYNAFACLPHTLEELVGKFASVPLDFPPGSSYHYSNSNYNLLALIIEKVSGEAYGDYIQKHIFDPAGMRDSGNDGDASRLIVLAASGYQPAGAVGFEKVGYLDWSNKTGNGSLYSTLDDLYRFDRALKTNVILKEATRQKYFVGGKGNRFGWFTKEFNGHRLMSSNGRSPGFTAELDRYPDDDVTIIVLSNSYATASQDPIAPALAAIVLGQQPPPGLPPLAKISDSILRSYAGKYQFGPDYFSPNAIADIAPGSGYLLMQAGTFRTPLIPISSTEFLDRNYLARVEISPASGSQPGRLTYRYGGKEFVATRVPTSSPGKSSSD